MASDSHARAAPATLSPGLVAKPLLCDMENTALLRRFWALRRAAMRRR